MKIVKLMFKNLFRHKLRTFLTIMGIAVAVMAFGLLRTIVTAWSAGVEASSTKRMIVRHAVSFILPLPYAYKDQLEKVPGVKSVSFASWFGGVYKDNNPEDFFPRFAVDANTFLKLYPEFIISDDELANFQATRNGCVVGKKLADQHGFKIGDIIPIQGDIFPGKWEFVVKGIYKGKDRTTDETQMLFQWEYIDEALKADSPNRAGNVGWYILDLENAGVAPDVTAAVDGMYLNSSAKTKTETEAAFQQSFVSLSGAILSSLQVISYVIIGIILLILANTIVMSARERIREYAVLKTLGFGNGHVASLIAGESLLISLIGGIIGLFLAFPVIEGFGNAFPTMFPVFHMEISTIIMCIGFSLLVGISASVFPAYRSSQMSIVDGLRQIG